MAKAYSPIGLLDTIPNFSTLCTKHISYLAEKHNLHPLTQFRGRPGRNTTDTWRKGKMAATLFLDVQGAFPNIVKDQLIHNMQMR